LEGENMQNAVMTPKTLSRDAQRLISAIEESQKCPDLLDDETARMLRSLARAIKNGTRLTAKQAWAIEAIHRRVLRGERRDGATVAQTTPSPVMAKPVTSTAESKVPPAPPATDASRLPVHAIVRHSMHGRGCVIIAEPGKSIVSFDYGEHVRVANDRLKLVRQKRTRGSSIEPHSRHTNAPSAGGKNTGRVETARSTRGRQVGKFEALAS
jgi:hypothetical protein